MSVGLVVHLTIEEEHLETFLDIAKKHGEHSVAAEPGCLSFTVMRSTEEEGKVFLCETYADRAALDAHWNSDHMQAYRERTGHMIKTRDRYLGEVV